MINLTITKQRFLDWYLLDNQTTELEQLKEFIANNVIQQIKQSGTAKLDTETLFDLCNQDAIKLCYTREFEESEEEQELGDLFADYRITLVE